MNRVFGDWVQAFGLLRFSGSGEGGRWIRGFDLGCCGNFHGDTN